MQDEPKALREIHDIRERHYEERKDWTEEQLIEHLRRLGSATAKKLGLKVAPLPEEQRKKKTG